MKREEETPADSPLARAARDALRAPMARFRVDFEKSLTDLEARVCEALVEAVNNSYTQKQNELRLARLEEYCFRKGAE